MEANFVYRLPNFQSNIFGALRYDIKIHHHCHCVTSTIDPSPLCTRLPRVTVREWHDVEELVEECGIVGVDGEHAGVFMKSLLEDIVIEALECEGDVRTDESRSTRNEDNESGGDANSIAASNAVPLLAPPCGDRSTKIRDDNGYPRGGDMPPVLRPISVTGN
ncbi:hypothetical protein PIB30_055306 [Stylosanthes scabra]|uniref:Uncharacterized protein n=1 Tax=Stylosanthes scabra TaxID=79078 RepID=A0ABU6ZHP0_9FABA|nr:hypothetical protein [Stylosanthes scabra]